MPRNGATAFYHRTRRYDTNISQVSVLDGERSEYRTSVHGPADPGALGCLASLKLYSSGNVAVFVEHERGGHLSPIPLLHKEELTLVHNRYDRDECVNTMREVSDLDTWDHRAPSDYQDGPAPAGPSSIPSLVSGTTSTVDDEVEFLHEYSALQADTSFPDLLTMDTSEISTTASSLRISDARSLQTPEPDVDDDIPTLQIRTPISTGAVPRNLPPPLQPALPAATSTPVPAAPPTADILSSDEDEKKLIIDLDIPESPALLGDANKPVQTEECSPCPTPGSPYVPSDDPDDPDPLGTTSQDEEWDPVRHVPDSDDSKDSSDKVGLGRGSAFRPQYNVSMRSVRQILRRRRMSGSLPSHLLEDNTEEETSEVEPGCRRNDKDGK